MSEQLDCIEHISINVADIERAVAWYRTSFRCEIVQQSLTHAVLRFENLRLVLTLPNQEQPHIGFVRSDASTFGELRRRTDGSLTTYLADPTGNIVEIVAPEGVEP